MHYCKNNELQSSKVLEKVSSFKALTSNSANIRNYLVLTDFTIDSVPRTYGEKIECAHLRTDTTVLFSLCI